MEKRDVVIVGAGPAGLKAAEVLANNGRDVLVLEQKKIIGDKVCAGGLTLKDFELGIPKRLAGRKFRRIVINTPLQKISMRDNKVCVATIDRKVLGKWMAGQAKKAGAEIRANSFVSRIGKDYVSVGKGKIKFNYLIGADGANSIVRQSLGLKDKNVIMAIQYKTKKGFRDLEIFIDFEKFGPWYNWIFPHKGYTLIGSGAALRYIKLSKLKENFDRWCSGKFDIKKAEFQAHTIRFGYRGHKFGNKFLAGDAGGFASALTGEGICFAILSGIDVARKIIDKKCKCPNIEHVLKVKKVEEGIMTHMERHGTLAKYEIEALTFIARSRWVDRKLMEYVE